MNKFDKKTLSPVFKNLSNVTNFSFIEQMLLLDESLKMMPSYSILLSIFEGHLQCSSRLKEVNLKHRVKLWKVKNYPFAKWSLCKKSASRVML